jgi:hypothetical protein
MNKTTSCLAALVLAGCAAQPVEERIERADSVVFVQHGEVPLSFSAGVVDIASFWATYGDAVSRQLGYSDVIDGITETGKEVSKQLEPVYAELVESLFGDHPLADNIAAEVIPAVARSWSIELGADDVVVLPAHGIVVDIRDDTLRGNVPDADVVFVIEVPEVRLTEVFSSRSVLASGVMLGSNRKALTAEVPVDLLVFARDADSSHPRLVWSRRCGSNYTSVDVAAPLDELVLSPTTMTALLDASQAVAIDRCLAMLDAK